MSRRAEGRHFAAIEPALFVTMHGLMLELHVSGSRSEDRRSGSSCNFLRARDEVSMEMRLKDASKLEPPSFEDLEITANSPVRIDQDRSFIA
jgi:hypothetical protein